jgi:hypothetical protein
MPDEPTLPDGPLLVVSPEPGDAALSCAALLDRVEPLTVLDVFTLVPEPDQSTEWDRAAGFESAAAAMAAREQEESDAFADTFHEVLAVDLLAQRYRTGARDATDERRFRRALEGWVGRVGSCAVVLPAGAGIAAGATDGIASRARVALGGRRPMPTDPDHLWVRDTATRILRPNAQVELWLYEELPHLEARPADRAVSLFARWCERRAEPLVVSVDRARKAARLGTYATMVPGRLGSARRLAHRLPRTERYWALRRSI